jgi:iron-sulfur cluster repair protein YtfE (RIC family)
MNESQIAKMPLDELVSRYPEIAHLLHNFGIDLRGGKSRTLEQVAEARGLDVEMVLEVVSGAVALIEEAERVHPLV